MQAILARAFGGPEVLKLEDVPDPAAKAGQVRVRIHAIGVNPYETYMRAGAYAIKPDLPFIPGADAAGVIDQIGDSVTGWKKGDRVYISGTELGDRMGVNSTPTLYINGRTLLGAMPFEMFKQVIDEELAKK